MNEQGYTVSNQIRTLRAFRRMSQSELAALAGLRQDRISEIERGIMPNNGELARIKTALNWPSDEAMAEVFALLAGEPAACSPKNGERVSSGEESADDR